ncbi:MAG: bifunctional glutamate N-acetyltransferase/amino-acid acetyltransferase ArgJ [Victivallaceae bacterium]
MNKDFKEIANGSVTSPRSFKASGITAGLKRSGAPDMAMIYSDVPANFSGAFTSCTFAAAPVQVCRNRVLTQQKIQAIIVNSGNANACTGKQGVINAEKMCAVTASELGIKPEAIMVSSTGRIGVQLPLHIIEPGIAKAAAALAADGGPVAARAIMTTDTVPKAAAVSFEIDGKAVTIGAMTKGAGMIDPKMRVPHATMLCYITTDAGIENQLLAEFIKSGVEESFNRITIDGDMSTNDTTIIMANGQSGIKIEKDSSGAQMFYAGLLFLMQKLARMMVLDGEGATKFVTVKINNAPTEKDAALCAEAIANSLLCKTAWFGCDPNWGRIVAALGYSGAEFDPDKVTVHYNDKPVVIDGQDAGTPEKELAVVLKDKEFTITVNLNAGNFDYWVWTCDISYEYVKINAEYHT